MNDEAYADAFLEKEIKARFGVGIELGEMIVRHLSVGPAMWAHVFTAADSNMYAFILGTKTMTLGEVRRILKRMGLRADKYYSPYGRDNYFANRAEAKFKETYPGKPISSDQDLMYYKTLVPYSPAFVSILEVPDNRIRGYDADTAGGWRVVKKLDA
ncbi:hypothetical protein FACS189431_1070 [Alphaproteobacteria bacterium]|nr:hypothetical protein FACS189431_1070 [Alphaproteobacteria bacterium]